MKDDQGPRHECFVCGKLDVTEEHVRNCFFSDTSGTSEKNGVSLALSTMFVKLGSIKEFHECYNGAFGEQKERMWICPKCFDFGSSPAGSTIFSLPERCLSCGNEQIEAAMPYLARLIR